MRLIDFEIRGYGSTHVTRVSINPEYIVSVGESGDGKAIIRVQGDEEYLVTSTYDEAMNLIRGDNKESSTYIG